MPPPQSELVLVQGLYNEERLGSGRSIASREQRYRDITQHSQTLGVVSYEWVDGHAQGMANRLLRRMRGTACPPDAVEILSIDESGLRNSLAGEAGRAQWRAFLGCESGGYDVARSFILMGATLRLLEGDGGRQRILWFGNGLDQLSRAEFIEHYTTRHGPLVAGHAPVIGLRSYRQVPAEQGELCCSLRELGLGRAPSPAVFAELTMGAPPFSLSAILARRTATREIKVDEQRHISFSRSMLLLTASAIPQGNTVADTT